VKFVHNAQIITDDKNRVVGWMLCFESYNIDLEVFFEAET
jgi:hypothetical protein